MTESALAQRPETGSNVAQTSAVLSMIERVASDPNSDVAKLEKMLDMQERVLDRQAKEAFSAAMTKAQSEMVRISADAENPQTRSRYASYAQLDRHLRPIYSRHGFALSFDTADEAADGVIVVLCHVMHEHGHSKTYRARMPADGKGAKGNAVMTATHAAGAAMSYGMRYLLKMIWNVAVGEDDTDGNIPGAPTAQPVSDEVAAKIREMVEALPEERAGAFWQTLRDHFRVTSIDDLTATDAEKVRRRLIRTLEELGQ